MAENAEAERHVSQAVLAALSVALGIGMQLQHQRAAAARRALAESEDRQKQLAAQLAAERETAAVLWSKIDDREWVRSHPQQVAEAWASARAWEQVDTRAAEARARFDALLGALYDQKNPLIGVARDSEDYAALAALLQRAVDVDPDLEGTTQYYEEVPAGEREAWLERQVWGPDSTESDRIARSSELADMQAGLPVAVLREMSAETRGAWLELQAMSPQERYAWRRSWLEQQVWGPDSDPLVRTARARALEELIAASPNTPVEFTADEWNEFVNQFRDRMEQAVADGTGSGEGEPAGAVEQAAQPGDAAKEAPATTAEAGTPENGTAASPEPTENAAAAQAAPETKAERLDRTRAALRDSWPPEVAEAAIGADAFGALAHSLHQLEERGYSMEDILGKISPEGLVGLDRYGLPVRDSAALAQYHVKQLATSLPSQADAEAGIEELEQYVAEHQGGEAAGGEQPDTPAEAEREAEGSGTTPAQAGGPTAAPQPMESAQRSGEQAKYDTAVEAIRSVWPHDADWIVGSQTRSVTRLAETLELARQQGNDPIQFMRDAVIASGKERVIQPNRGVGEPLDPQTTTTYGAGIPHPGAPGADPAAFAAAQVRKQLRNHEAGSAPETPAATGPSAQDVGEVFAEVLSAQPTQVVDDPPLREEDVDRQAPERTEPSTPSGPSSPWSRSGAGQRGLGGDPDLPRRDAAAAEDARAEEDHFQAEQLRAERDDVLDRADDPGEPAAAAEAAAEKAETLTDGADQRDNAAGEHEKAAEDLRGGAYGQGGDAAQLAGQGYPRDIKDSLAKGGPKGSKQGKAPKARRWRGQQAERGR